jgi:hypothetical protein
MKHPWKWLACAIIVFAGTTLVCAQQSLGDVARQERARPKPHAAKVITNDDIPSVATPEPDSATTNEKKSAAAPGDESDKNKPPSAADKIKQIEMWKSKIAAQEAKVQALDEQVGQIDRDYKLRMSAFYADLGTRLRDEAKWAQEQQKFQDEMAAKQKERDAERDKLDDMKEQARRAGVNGID